MPSIEPPLAQLIRETIRERGPVTFAWFMEQTLYHPEHGYYSSGRCAIGRHGDYFTNVSVGPLFGRLLAVQFVEMWTALGRPEDFAIVEQGAHDGELAHDVLTAAQTGYPDFFHSLKYIIVEPFPILRQQQEDRLGAFKTKVRWHRSLEELAPFRGVHFSNELLDAMPVHLVRWTGAEWRERHVTEAEGALALVDLPLSGDALAKRVRAVPLPLPAGYETEVSLAVCQWIEKLAPKLVEGFVLVVDYGWARDEFFSAHRSTGTLRSYRQHRVVSSPLQHPGEADITAHVEWTTVIETAEECGLTLRGFNDQHHFITGLLAENLEPDFAPLLDAKAKRSLQTLLHPSQLGMRFQYLCLEKNVRQPTDLSGFRYAKQPTTERGSI